MVPGVSDHSPVILHCTPTVISRPKNFNLFKTVLARPQFVETVTNTWAHYNGTRIRMYQLNLKLKTQKNNLRDLNTHLASYANLQQTRLKLEVTQDMLATDSLNQQLIEEE